MSQSSWIEKDHQDQIRHANDWQVLAIFKRTVEHQPKLPGGKPYAEDETSFSPVRVLVSRPGPLDQHGAADPMVHVIHCTGSMRGRLLHEEQKNASCLCNRCPGPNCHPSCCHGVCVSMSYLPFHIYEKKSHLGLRYHPLIPEIDFMVVLYEHVDILSFIVNNPHLTLPGRTPTCFSTICWQVWNVDLGGGLAYIYISTFSS